VIDRRAIPLRKPSAGFMKRGALRGASWWAMGGLGFLLLCAVAALVVVGTEARLEGRFTVSWLRDLSTGGKDAAAWELFQRQGEKAVPGLVSAMDPRRATLARRMQKLPFYRWFPGRLKEWAEARAMMQALDRVWAIRLCASLGSRASNAEKALRAALTDLDPFVRGEAARALAQAKADPDRVVPLLVGLLSDADSGVRSQAAIGLGVYGERARQVLPRLRSLTNDPEMKVAFSARLAVDLIEDPQRVQVTTNHRGAVEYQRRP
jgi:hypothetical protein